MTNELAIVEDNWLILAWQTQKLPMPFEQTIFLTEYHLAGTDGIDDMLVRTKDVEMGTSLVLRRTERDAADARAFAVRTAEGWPLTCCFRDGFLWYNTNFEEK